MRQASQDCLTWGGSEAARCAVEGALQCLLGFAFRLQVRLVGRGARKCAMGCLSMHVSMPLGFWLA